MTSLARSVWRVVVAGAFATSLLMLSAGLALDAPAAGQAALAPAPGTLRVCPAGQSQPGCRYEG
ncbi:MAG: hypothetical protein ACREJ5_16370, partial [Geminicoccaceae bacterium]